MSIIVSEPVTERGRKDARRHREKQKKAIIGKLPEIIADESIITQRKNKIIKIPIRSINLPHFRPKTEGGEKEIGQGNGSPGDIIGQRPGQDGQPGEPGQEPGQDYIETEVEIEEIIELMLEDLGLPKLEEKEVKELIVELGFKIGGIVRSGSWPLLDRKATAQEGMKRFWSLLEALKTGTECDELTCFNALKQAEGLLEKSIELLKQGQVELNETNIVPFPIFEAGDLRYREIKRDSENQSNAVIIAMRDVSGSMDDMKVYLSQAMLFWLVRWLEKVYKNVEVRFIIHHSTAKNVDEEDFFRTGGRGGTNCYTAYELANSLVDTEYPTNRWNVYVWHFSDGEDSDPDRTIEEMEKLIDKKVNMIGYGEVQPDANPSFFKSERSGLWQKFKNYFTLKEIQDDGLGIAEGNKELPLLCIRLMEREHILPALKAFLKKDRWAQ